MGGGVRTLGHWNHNPALYQLSYTHRGDSPSLSGTLQPRQFCDVFEFVPCRASQGRTRGNIILPAEHNPQGWPIPVVYGAIRIDIGFGAGLIVEDQVIVEQVSTGARTGPPETTSDVPAVDDLAGVLALANLM